MISKMLEIRDLGTFIPILAVKLSPENDADRHLLARAGYGLTAMSQAGYIQLVEVAGGKGRTSCDPYDWGGRTLPVAHRYIIDQFDTLASGAVVDVEFILGETSTPKVREAEEVDP